MKLVKTLTRTNLTNLDKYTDKLAKESLDTLNVLLEVAPVCTSEDEYRKEHQDVEEYPYFQLDELGKLLDIADTEMMLKFAQGLAARDMVTNRRLRSALDFKAKLLALVEQVSDAYVPLSEEEINTANKLIGQAIGHLSTFIYYQFGLDETRECMDNNEELEVNLDLLQYGEVLGQSAEDLVNLVDSARKAYKPNMPIFEEFPELEDEFIDIAGAYVQDFEALDDYITKEDVITVLENPNLDLEAFIKSIEGRKDTGTKEMNTF